MDPIDQLKQAAKAGWNAFVPMEAFTAQAAPVLVRVARVGKDASVLDVACGTGPVAITAARNGAKVSGLDLAPDLVARAKENAAIAGVRGDFVEGDCEALPYADATFDFVLSQFGHMFAPRPDVAIAEMLRVLRPGGTIAFSTWPPDGFVGRFFGVVAHHAPPPPVPLSPPSAWGDPRVVEERLGPSVRDVFFDRSTMAISGVSPQHLRLGFESFGPLAKLVGALASDQAKLAALRDGIDAVIADFWEPARNSIRQDFLVTRAIKR